MTRKSSKSGKSSRQKLSSEDIGNSEGQTEPLQEPAGQGDQSAQEPDTEAEAESDTEPEPEAPTLTELIINKFAGEKVNNQFEGYGFMEFANGNLYEGNFYQGTMHDKGKYIWTETGMIYEGDFYCNQITGIGKYTWPDGSAYEGQVVQGVRHGVGIYTHPSGICYDGQWHMGQKQGQGKLTYTADGSSYYEGQWFADKRHGEGLRRYPSGNVYQGMWYGGLRHGQGSMRWADKDETYTGQWEDGVQHGVGQHIWYLKRAPGSQYMLRNIYDGDFVSGKRHGYGVFYYPSGSRYEGRWADDVKCGHGKFVFKNGRVFEGQFKDDRMVEFPSFTHDGRTTPDHASIRTRSPLPGEAQSVHSNASANTVSPGFQLCLDHIVIGAQLFDCDLEEETAQVSFVSIHYLGKLRKVYNFYATLGTMELEDNANVLTMMQFWRLMKDCEFINEDWTLAKFDRMLISSYEALTPESAHNPRKEVVFLDFLNHLVTIAYYLYSPTIKTDKGILASCFRKLLQEKLLPNACSVRGHLYQEAQQRGQHATAYAKSLWPVFQQQCRCESHGGCSPRSAGGGRRSGPGQEWVMTVRQFLRMLSQFKLLDEQRLTPAKVVEILSSDDKNISDGDFLLLDREMTFLEFFEGLVGCASVAVVIEGPGAVAAAAAAAVAASATAAAVASADHDSSPAMATATTTAAAASTSTATVAPATPAPDAAKPETTTAVATVVVAAASPSQPPALPDESYLLAPPEPPPTEAAASEAGDQPAGSAADSAGGSTGDGAAAGAKQSGVDSQHHRSRASESGSKAEKAGGGGGGGATGRGSLRAPLTARDGAKDRQQPSRANREQDKKSDAGGVGPGGRKSQKTAAAAAAAAAHATVASGADEAASGSREAADDDAAAGRDSREDAMRVTSEVDASANQDEQEFLLEDEVASLTDEEKKALVATRRYERWQRQLSVFLTERLAPAAELQAVIQQRIEQRHREEMLEMMQRQQLQQQQSAHSGGDQSQVDGNGDTEQGAHTEDNQSVGTGAAASREGDENEEEEEE